MNDLDLLIDTMVSDAQIATGTDPRLMQARDGIRRAAPGSNGFRRNPGWTAEEDAFMRDNLRVLGIAGVAEVLGRSEVAVKVRFTRELVPAPSKADGWVTANKAAGLLGLDAHKVTGWIDDGFMPGHLMDWSERKIRMISIVRLKMWLVKPETWVYVNVRRIRQASLRRLVELAQGRWGDEWWSTNQAAAFHGCENKDILRYIKAGKLRAIQSTNAGGRGEAGWSHWYARKSDVLKLVVFRGKGSGNSGTEWPARADAFMLRSRAEGRTKVEMARMMKWPVKRVAYRLWLLVKKEVAA